MAYTKLWHRIVTSSIWDADDKTRLVWITMLALANRDGFVESSFKALAMLARVDHKACRHALQVLSSPDPDSRTKTDDGRRIEERDGGWQIINYDLYRNATSDDPHVIKNRERQRRFREKQALRNVSKRDAASASSSVSNRGDARGGEYSAEFETFWQSYPRRQSKAKAFKAWRAIKDRPPVAELVNAVHLQARSKQWQDGIVPHASTWLNGRRWEDEIEQTEGAKHDGFIEV